MPDPLAQRALRLLFLNALKSIPGVPFVLSPGDWSVAPEKVPQIQVRAADVYKETKGNQGPIAFDSDVVIEVRAVAAELTGEQAQDAVETLGAYVEDAVLTSIVLSRAVQLFRSVQSRTEITAHQSRHYAAITWAFRCQVYERFDPVVTAVLAKLHVTADLVNVADPTGTYPDAPFPDAVKPAPRTQGPDGRAEGEVDVQFPQ